MKPRLLIWGTGSMAATISSRLNDTYEIVAYVVDDNFCRESSFQGKPCLPFSLVRDGNRLEAELFFCSIGYGNFNRNRADCVKKMRALGLKAISWVSPHAVVEDDVAIGENCYVGAGCIIDSRTVIEDSVTVLPGAIIGHDSVVRSNSYICQGVNIPGFVRIGNNCFVGTGAVFADGVEVGDFCFIKAGARVFRSLAENNISGEHGQEEGLASDYFREWYAGRERYYASATAGRGAGL